MFSHWSWERDVERSLVATHEHELYLALPRQFMTVHNQVNVPALNFQGISSWVMFPLVFIKTSNLSSPPSLSLSFDFLSLCYLSHPLPYFIFLLSSTTFSSDTLFNLIFFRTIFRSLLHPLPFTLSILSPRWLFGRPPRPPFFFLISRLRPRSLNSLLLFL